MGVSLIVGFFLCRFGVGCYICGLFCLLIVLVMFAVHSFWLTAGGVSFTLFFSFACALFGWCFCVWLPFIYSLALLLVLLFIIDLGMPRVCGWVYGWCWGFVFFVFCVLVLICLLVYAVMRWVWFLFLVAGF